MEKTNRKEGIMKLYKQGTRHFVDLDLEKESFDNENLEGVIFEKCFLYSSFRGANLRNAKFIDGNIKTCDFREADLTNAHFENLSVEGVQFARAITEGIYFDNNHAYGDKVMRTDFDEWIKDHEE